MHLKTISRLAGVAASLILISACGGGGGDDNSNPPPPPPPDTFSIGGTVDGLPSGMSVVLQNNGADDLTVDADGDFTFGDELEEGDDYEVTVLTQPGPGQVCTVTDGSGTVGTADVTDVTVTCQAQATFSIGGTVNGLATGASVVLQNNGGNDLTVDNDGAFTFVGELADGEDYEVTVLTQPTGPAQTCTVTDGSGTVATADVTDVDVTCANDDLTVPTVSETTPLEHTIGTAVQGGVITATFSEAMDTSTIDSSSFTVEGPTGPATGTITFAAGDTQAVFTPTSRLAYDATYIVTLNTDVADPTGNGLASDVVWSFNTGKKLALGYQHTCARLDDGSVKCWGRNQFGQLGYDDKVTRGDGVGPGTETLAAVNLGAGRTAVAITAGDYHTCAILDNGDSKCWGRNKTGELGQGSIVALGDAAGEMAALPPIDLGAGRHAIEITAGQAFTCARLDDNSVKCWGRNQSGQLGKGNNVNLGITPGDIAASAPINFGTGLTPIQMSLGHYHGCAILLDAGGDSHTKCWGDNRWGQLGHGDQVNLGDTAGEMGDNLPELNFGTGLSAEYLMATGGHSCAKLSDLSVKCWGLNTWGAVGLIAGNGAPVNKLLCNNDPKDCVGDDPGEMGNALTAAIAAGTADKLTLGYRHSCALLLTGQFKCWGSNEEGQVGIGNNTGNNVNIGDQAGEIAALATTVLKPGTDVEEATGGGFQTCVLNDDDTINCWGFNSFGQLGHNDTATWGDDANEMGADLIDVDLGP